MREEKNKQVIAWTVGVCSFIVIYVVSSVTLDKMGVPTYIDYIDSKVVYTQYGSEVRYGESTTIGTALCLLSVMFSARFGMAVFTGRLDGGVSKKGNIEFVAWAFGITAFAIVSWVISVFTGFVESSIFNIISGFLLIGFALAIFVGCKRWRDNRTRIIDDSLYD